MTEGVTQDLEVRAGFPKQEIPNGRNNQEKEIVRTYFHRGGAVSRRSEVLE